MNIVSIGTYDINGGAARAAYRLHTGLLQIGQSSEMIVRVKNSSDDSIIQVQPQKKWARNIESFHLNTTIQEHYIDRNRTSLSDTIFSLTYPGYDLTSTNIIQSADVVNLHWINQFQSVVTLKRIFDLQKPVVWTLHDQWPFTGGCHYSAGCDNYVSDCSECPQLSPDLHMIPEAALKDKIELFKEANLTIVTPSQWLAECARKSRLFRGKRVEVIPNSVELDHFRPFPKHQAKAKFGIYPETRTILFGAETIGEKRKGFSELILAMKLCLADAGIKDLVSKNRLRFLVFGQGNESLRSLGIPFTSFGFVTSDDLLADIYSAADMFILPSIEDNLPNTMLEAMSCGTPVVAFRTGGMPDVITDHETGMLAMPFDAESLSNGMVRCIKDREISAAMGKKCSNLIKTNYSQDRQARRYLNLYQELVSLSASPQKGNKSGTFKIMRNSSRAEVVTEIGPFFFEIYEQTLSRSVQHVRLSRLFQQYKNRITKKLIQSLCFAFLYRLTARFGRLSGRIKAS